MDYLRWFRPLAGPEDYWKSLLKGKRIARAQGVPLEVHDRPLKVLVITPDYPPRYTGGCAFSCQLLVDGLRSRGVRTDVWAFNGDSSRPAETGEMGDTLFFRGSRTLLGLNRLAYAELRRRRPDVDIIHVYNTQQLPAAVRYARGNGTRVAATLNNLAPICTNPGAYVEGSCAGCGPRDTLACALQRPGPPSMKLFMSVHWVQYTFLHRLSRRADGYIALSEATRKCYLDAGYDPGRIRLIPNMFDPELVILDRPPRGAMNKVILYVGRLEAEKGIQVLIRAFSLLKGGSVLYIVGTGGYEGELKALSRELGLEGRVIFTGFVEKDEIGRYYQMADVFVHPALWPEPFPRTILEALAHRLPIVLSDSGSSAEILGEAGLSFRNGDERGLAIRLEMMLEDEGPRRRAVMAGAAVLQRYSPDAVLSQVLSFYDEMLS